jgi:hypothetical protein
VGEQGKTKGSCVEEVAIPGRQLTVANSIDALNLQEKLVNAAVQLMRGRKPDLAFAGSQCLFPFSGTFGPCWYRRKSRCTAGVLEHPHCSARGAASLFQYW